MPDLRQALKDFVATSNSGKYTTEQELMSKFPELKGYNVQALRDFVATSNSGKYATEDELFSKFPEFNQGPKVKKKFALDSSSEDGSSALQKSTNQPSVKMATLTQKGFEEAMSKRKSTPTDMSGTTVLRPEIEKNLKPVAEKVEKENKILDIEKKKYENIFDKQLGLKYKPTESAYLTERLKSIDTNLINQTEENVVAEMDYQFWDLGFKFEETGALGDYMKVTAPNGKTKEISLDNFLNSKSSGQATELKQFIKENTPAKGLFVLENTLKEQDRKFNSQKQVDDATKSITNDVNALNAKQKQFIAKKNQFDKQLADLGPNPTKEQISFIESQKAALNEEMKAIIQEEEKIKARGKKLDSAVGKYTFNKSKQGGWFGGIINSFLGGIGKMASGLTGDGVNIITELAPTGYGMDPKELKDISKEIASKIGVKGPSESQTIEQWKKTLTEDQLDAWEDEVDDYVKKGLKTKTLPAIRVGAKQIFGDRETTQQWADLKKKGFWGGALLGLAESLPAMIGGTGPAGWAQRTAQMYSQISDGLSEEMENNPEFKNISENEKLAITLPIGITSAILEEFGFRNLKASKGIINSLTLKALGKAGTGVTAKTFRELVENEVSSAIARGALTITAAGAAEFETGGAQELSETKFKDLYNYIKGEKMFQTPDSISDLMENIIVSGAQEAVGGFILGIPTGVSAAYTQKGFLKLSDAEFEAFTNMANDENMQSAYIASLKDKITQGIMTTQEAKDHLNSYRNAVGLYRQLPEGLDTEQQKEAMNLLKEKRDLENYVNGKDPALVVKQKERISEINDSLTKLTEPNAIQEQSTTEIPVQSETGVSETVEEGVSEPKSEVVTEQVTQEEVTKPVIAQVEETAPQTIIEAIEDRTGAYEYDGKKGAITTIGQTVVLETPTEIIDLGNVDELKDSTLEDFGIVKAEDILLNDDNSVSIGEVKYLNNYSNPDSAINQDKDGNYSVTLDTENGQKRTFRGQQADQIVYQMKLKNFEQNGTEQQIDQANELADEAIRIEEETGTPSTEREGKTVRKAKRNKIISQEVSLPPITITSDVSELLNLDTKDKGSLQRVLDFLDKADDALTLDPNELNDVTRVMAIATAKAIVKTLKALVNAGITLQEAIRRASEENNVKPEQIIDALDIVSKINENVSEGVSEMEAPGYNQLSQDIDNMIANDANINEALDSVKESDVYKNATDVQRDLLVRDVRKRFGLRQKSAPSVAKLFGTIKDVKKITMREKDLLIKQIKDKAKGAKDAVVAFKKINQELAKDIDELVKTGKITPKQAANAIKKFSKVNPFSNKSVSGFVDYMSKLFENADYANSLSNAKSLRKDIKSLSKNDKKNAQLTNLAAEFINIDPSMVDNIDDYNEQASKLKKAIQGSNLRGGKLNVADTVDIDEVSGYVADTMGQQENKIREQKIAELQDLLDVDASEFSAEDIDELLKPDTKIDDNKEKIIRASIKKAFNIYSSMIKEQIKTGVDAFTGEDVSYTEDQKDLIKRFMTMDTNNMDVKDSLAVIDSLVNFLVNHSTARMETVVQQYEKTQNAKDIFEKGIKAVPLRKLFSTKFGKFLGEQTSNIGLLLEKSFVGFNSSALVKKAMGWFELANGASKGVADTNKIVNDYVKQFYDKKANGQKFNTLFNMVERGMTAFVIRNVIGNEAKTKAEFARRKNLIKETIDSLLEYGNEQEKKEGAEYQKVYDKILKDSNNAEEVMSKVDNQNLEAVNWWINQWNNKYDKLSDLALNVYNTVLGRDVNYAAPDKFKKFSFDESIEDLSNNESSFVKNTDGVTYKKESSGLMKATRPESLPTNEKTKTPKYYIDLSFDKVNANAMHDALIDLETAAPIRGIEAFMNSPYFRKIMGSNEDAKLIRGRINNYIRNTRNKSMFSNDELSSAYRALNKIATLGASQALGGPSQPFKQVIPVVFNTLINSGGRLAVTATSDPTFMKWFKDAGFATGNRGVESLAEIDSINKLIEQASESKGAKFWKLIEKANEKQLKFLLSNPDRWIAITSWKTYYEQSLRKQGLKPDYTNGEINEDAANYAEEMVSRQQNASDKNMAGNLFTAKDTATNILTKVLMPFGSFRMNQSTRLGSDLRVLEYWNTSSKEDKLVAARSLAGFAVEQITFKAISLAFAILFDSISAKIMDVDDDDEEREKRRNAIYKGQATGIVTDVFSPLPIFDKPLQGLASFSLNSIQEGLDIDKKDMIELYGMGKEDFAKSLGMFGITLNRGYEIYETLGLAITGKYKDNFGRTKEISEDKKNNLLKLIGPMLVSNITGTASPEMSSVMRNSVRYAKKKGLTSDQIDAKEQKNEEIEQLIEKANTSEEVEALEKILEKQENPEEYAEENKEIKEMKQELLYDEVKDIQYDNESDLKRYDKKLWKKNFGPDSEYYKLTIDEKNANKKIKAEIRKNKDEKYGYIKPVKKRKNKDGTYKKSYSRSKSSDGYSSSSSSESYDSNGVRKVTTKSYGKKYGN